jgi:hypothetical protein
MDEMTINCLLQMGTLLMTYLALGFLLPKPWPFLATATSIPLFFSFPKSMLFDFLSEFLVATTLATWALYLSKRPRPLQDNAPPSNALGKRDLIFLLVLGTLSATALLSKQSTGTGLLLGNGLGLVVSPSVPTARKRLCLVLFLLLSTLLGLGMWMLPLSSYISIHGLWQDVFLRGTEYKGGTQFLGKLLSSYLLDLTPELVVATLLHLLLYKFPLPIERRRKIQSLLRTTPIPFCLSTYLACLLSATVWLLTLNPNTPPPPPLLPRPVFFAAGWAGLLLLCLRARGSTTSSFPGSPCIEGSPCLVLVALAAAVFNALSYPVPEFPLHFSNQPLIPLTMASFFLSTLLLLEFPWPTRQPHNQTGRHALMPLLVFLVGTTCWAKLSPELAHARRCSQAWPEIRHLAGARLRPSAEGMRLLVHTVRSITSNQDDVLLLPNDPHVETWFERPRPTTTSHNIFPDQYLDARVEEDFSLLARNPPAVIIIGPRNFWRSFGRMWHTDKGAERLIDLVQGKLLPTHYEHVSAHPIVHLGKEDYMDIYVRTDGRSQAHTPL